MRLLFVLLLLAPFSIHAQALRDINYSYLYNNANPVTVDFQTVRGTSEWTTFFQLVLADTTQPVSNYDIVLETRTSLAEKEGIPVSPDSEEMRVSGSAISGRVSVPIQQQPVVLAARVINRSQNRAWYYYTILEPNYPVVMALQMDDGPLVRNYMNSGESLKVVPPQPALISYYDDEFPPAPLPFSEQLGQVSKGMGVDSSFQAASQESFGPSNTGLYLVQTDTSVAEGVAFRVSDDYPRYRKVENLADPLIYISTKQEFSRIKQARGDKRAFDRVILSITKDTERAKTLMRNYFRRIELANTYFTSYKEGWKTDRGMILIIFGQPSEVYRLSDREVWNYKNESYKLSFDFVKAPSLFDPENYVLIRSRKYEQAWYEIVDLWRNSRY